MVTIRGGGELLLLIETLEHTPPLTSWSANIRWEVCHGKLPAPVNSLPGICTTCKGVPVQPGQFFDPETENNSSRLGSLSWASCLSLKREGKSGAYCCRVFQEWDRREGKTPRVCP
jgi:hypothetical protein